MRMTRTTEDVGNNKNATLALGGECKATLGACIPLLHTYTVCGTIWCGATPCTTLQNMRCLCSTSRKVVNNNKVSTLLSKRAMAFRCHSHSQSSMRCDVHKWTDIQHSAIPHNCLLLYWNYNPQQLHGTFRCLIKTWRGKKVRDAQYVYSRTKIIIIMTKCVIYIFRHMWHKRVLPFGTIHHKWTSIHASYVLCHLLVSLC